MAEQVAGALLFLVPVVMAAIVAYVITRPEREPEPEPTVEPVEPAPSARVVPFERRALDRRGGQSSALRRASAGPDRPASPPQTPLRRTPAAIAHPTLLHAALSSHLSAVSRTQTGAAQAASRAAGLSAVQAANAARLVSIRRPARIPRRPSHRCPHNPE